MQSEQFTIYVGMALTDAPEEFRTDFQQELKRQLRNIDKVRVLDFVGLENGSNTDVSRYDKKCTQEADLCVFILTYPSTGLGKEIAYREAVDKPALYFAAAGSRVTRMVLGELEDRACPLYRYPSIGYIAEIVGMYVLHQTTFQSS